MLVFGEAQSHQRPINRSFSIVYDGDLGDTTSYIYSKFFFWGCQGDRMPINTGPAPYFGGWQGWQEGVRILQAITWWFAMGLGRLNPMTVRLQLANKTMLADKFSREFRGLKGLNLCFEADYPFNSLENLKMRRVLLSNRSAGRNGFSYPKLAMCPRTMRKNCHPPVTLVTLQNRVQPQSI